MSLKTDDLMWVNGEFVKNHDCLVNITTHALHYGTAVFEGIRVYNSNIFKLKEHIDRLFISAKLVGMDIPFSTEDLIKASENLISKTNIKNAYIRPLVFAGEGTLKVVANNPVSVAIMTLPRNDEFFRDIEKKKSIKLNISKWRKAAPDSFPVQCKGSGPYITNNMIGKDARQKGFDDSLQLDFEGYIAEATTSNIFFVKDGVLHTPIADRFLNGVTRQAIIVLAKDNQVNVIERRIKPEELASFDECFSCGTSNEISIIESIENIRFGKPKISKKFNELYYHLVHLRVTA